MSDGASGGIGFLGLLTVAFVVLRLCGVIDWSWFWVLSPVLLPIIIISGVVSVYLIVAISSAFFK